MGGTLIDSNVLLDIVTEDEEWFTWSSEELARAADEGPLFLNPIIYAEVAAGFERIEDLDEALPASYYRRVPLPWESAFLAGQCFVKYRRRGGSRRLPLPDFYIVRARRDRGSEAADAGRAPLPRVLSDAQVDCAVISDLTAPDRSFARAPYTCCR